MVIPDRNAARLTCLAVPLLSCSAMLCDLAADLSRLVLPSLRWLGRVSCRSEERYFSPRDERMVRGHWRSCPPRRGAAGVDTRQRLSMPRMLRVICDEASSRLHGSSTYRTLSNMIYTNFLARVSSLQSFQQSIVSLPGQRPRHSQRPAPPEAVSTSTPKGIRAREGFIWSPAGDFH